MKLQNKLLTAVWVALILNIIVNFPARAQQYTKTFRVGFLSGGFPGSNLGYTPIRRELRELGYVEGKNITFEPRYAEDTLDRSRSLAEELVQLNVDLIIAGGTSDTEWARRATAKIPIVFLESVSDPVEQGFVESLARPGKNITGFTTGAWIMAGKRLDFAQGSLTQSVPCRCSLGSPGSSQCTTVEGKPKSGRAIGPAASFDRWKSVIPAGTKAYLRLPLKRAPQRLPSRVTGFRTPIVNGSSS